MFEINRTEIERAKKTAPPGYEEIIFNSRDASLDTETSIFISPEKYAEIREWKKNPAKPSAAPQRHFEFFHNSTGLGDAVSALYVAYGLADATGGKVTLYAHSSDWLKRASHPLVEVKQVKSMGPNASQNYGEEIHHADTRKNHYCRNIAKSFGIPEFKPAPPRKVDRSFVKKHDGKYVVMAPFSCYESRNWNKYRELTTRLEAEGYKVFGVGSANQKNKLIETFASTGATWIFGGGAAEIVELMLGADFVVGNDSGIPHLAGLLNIPAVAIHAGALPHEFLFSLAPSVRSVTAGAKIPRNDHNTAVLHSISVDKVMEAVKALTSPKAKRECNCTRKKAIETPKTLPTPPVPSMDDLRKRTLLGGKLDALLALLKSLKVDGDIAELGVYQGGSSGAMALSAPQRTIHAFDTYAGIPDATGNDVHKKGDFNDVGDTLEFLGRFPNVKTHKGFFPTTAEGLDALRFAMVHLDGDQYQSTIDGLKWFWPRLVAGGIMVLDDYGWWKCPGVQRAYEEFFGQIPHTKRLTGVYQMSVFKPN